MKALGMTILCTAVLVVALLPHETTAADAKASFVITGSSVGPIRLGRSTLPEAKSGFASGKRLRVVRYRYSCVASWRDTGLTVVYGLVGNDPRNPCVSGVAFTATVTNRALWRTRAGLRIGDGAERLRHLYPSARLKLYSSEPAGYWLVTARACDVVGGFPFPALLAHMSGGHVSSLIARITVCD